MDWNGETEFAQPTAAQLGQGFFYDDDDDIKGQGKQKYTRSYYHEQESAEVFALLFF